MIKLFAKSWKKYEAPSTLLAVNALAKSDSGLLWSSASFLIAIIKYE